MDLIKDGVKVEVTNERQAERFKKLGYLKEGEKAIGTDIDELIKENELLKREISKLKKQNEKMKENKE